MGIPTNDFATILTIATDAIKSIDGDITLSLNDMHISTTYEYDYYYDEYYEDQKLTNLNAMAMVNTDSNYIFENVKLIPYDVIPFKAINNGSLYTANLNGQNLNIGQLGNTLYAGINTSCENIPQQSMSQKWASEFNNSIFYVAFNVQNFINSKWGKELLKEMKQDSGYYATSRAIDMIDSVWVNAKDVHNAEFVISLTDKSKNSLEQIVSFALEMAQTYNN